MASSFFALFDDIASLLDDIATMSKDVASMSKVATKKTAGILGDDLAVNAEKATGFAANKELPVIWAITKGSFLNKIIILPIIFLLSYFSPNLITPILLIGGSYLAYEGAEKIFEYFFHKKKKENIKKIKVGLNEIDELEKKKIKSAIMVDFILSLEIIIIALNIVESEPFKNQIIVVAFVAIMATIGVYGIVALIVRLDDVGLKLITKNNSFLKKIGHVMIKALPVIIKILIIVGTFAMLVVAGGIYIHKINYLHHLTQSIPSTLAELTVGFVIGLAVLLIVQSFKLIYNSIKS